jgi:hypothetical protein
MSNQMPDVEVVLPARDQNQAMSVCSCKQHIQQAKHVMTLVTRYVYQHAEHAAWQFQNCLD